MLINTNSISGNIDVADDAIRNPLFHGYCLMIELIAFLVLWLSHWFDSCACHIEQLTLAKMNTWQKRAQMRETLGGDCIMNSRRGPEMATGEMLTYLQNLLRMASTVLLSELAHLGLDQAAIGKIMQDYSRAKQHLWFTLTMKNSFWSHEPWTFFGLAHRDEATARAVARRSLRLRDRLLREPHKPIHHITKVLLFTDLLLSQLRRFATGTPLDSLKELALIVAMFRFAFTSETGFSLNTYYFGKSTSHCSHPLPIPSTRLTQGCELFKTSSRNAGWKPAMLSTSATSHQRTTLGQLTSVFYLCYPS